MKADIKARWIEALKSGEYPQTKNALHRLRQIAEDFPPEGFCCLGVLCEIAVQDEVIDVDLTSRASVALYDHEYTGYLPETVVKWSGIDLDMGDDAGVRFSYREIEDLLTESEAVDVLSKNMEGTLSVADLNDSDVSFATIAKVIERVF